MAKILVIDDNDSLCRLISRWLQSKKHEVIIATNGKQGLDLYREQSPDLVITDIIMPDMDGIETIAAMRKVNPKVKFIMMSGGGQAATGQEYLQSTNVVLNTSLTIAKPFTMEDMLSMVNKALNR